MPEEWKPDDTWFLWRVPPLERTHARAAPLWRASASGPGAEKAGKDRITWHLLSMDGGWTIVSNIKKGGPAEAAGVRLGNRIHIIGDVTIRDGAHAS